MTRFKPGRKTSKSMKTDTKTAGRHCAKSVMPVRNKLASLMIPCHLSKATFKDWDSLSDENKKNRVPQDGCLCGYGRSGRSEYRQAYWTNSKHWASSITLLIMFASDNGSSSEVVRLKKQTGEIGEITRWTSLGGKLGKCRQYALSNVQELQPSRRRLHSADRLVAGCH